MATRETTKSDKAAKEGNGDGATPADVAKAEEIGFGEVKHDLPDKDTCLTVLAKMMLIRRFEERAGEMYAKAKIGGFLHLCIGEEATVVGATQALKDTDYLMSTYREHGQALARGTHPNAVMAELFGRQDGCSRGRGGSMHLFDWDKRFLGGYGIVGGSLPLSAGVALACDYMDTEDAILSMMGDGATNQGTFGETMNLAALWQLPVVFLIINNQFGMGTALHRHSAITDLSKKSEGFGVPGTRCDGMDALDVHSVVTEALKHAREDRRPQLVEAVTYRYRGHSMADPEEYRTKEEVEEWRERDPIKAFADRLVDEGVLERGRRREVRPGGRSRSSTRPSASPTSRPSPTSTRSTTTSTSSTATCPPGGPWTSARPRCTAASASARPASCRTSWPSRAPPTRGWATARRASAAPRRRRATPERSRTHRDTAAGASGEGEAGSEEPAEEGGAD